MHAPVHVFIGAKISDEGNERADRAIPAVKIPREQEHGNHADRDDRRAVPPRHRNLLFVVFVDDMISVVGFENMVMHDGVRVERVTEIKERAVHEILVQRPFEERGEHDTGGKTDRGPHQKCFEHKNKMTSPLKNSESDHA